MRICCIAYTYYEVDNRVLRYAEALAARGDHVDVITAGRPGSKKFEIINGVHVYRVQEREINEKRKLDYLLKLLAFLFNSFRALTRLGFGRRYDVIHVHSIPDFEVFAAIWAKLRGTRVILDIHDLVPEFFNSKFKKDTNSLFYKMLLLEEKLSLAFANHVIIANDLWRETLCRRALRAEKCSVFLNYPDPKIFYYRGKTEHSDEFKIAFPGTLSPHQGVDVLIGAMELIRAAAPQCKLYIYGVGSEKPKLIELARELQLQESVLFKDIVPIQQLAAIMSNVDLCVVPKRRDSFGNEAFSTKIFESMTLGVPVLCSDTKIDTFYFTAECVKFFESGNARDLAEKLLWLIAHPEERERLARNALEYIKQHNWEIHQQRYFELVDALANHRQYVPKVTEHAGN